MHHRNYKKLKVTPNFPDELSFLSDLAKNFWFSWYPSIGEMFESIDMEIWKKSKSNPYRMLLELDKKTLDTLHEDKSFLTHLTFLNNELKSYLGAGGNHDDLVFPKNQCIAYFCAEFGLHESFPNYSGGLGILAGDHIKTASDMSLPLVAVGLLYRYGYFSQYLNSDGWQQERYPLLDTFSQPLEIVLDEKGKPIILEIPFPDRTIYAQAWKVKVGKVPLYLLSTNVDENSFEDKQITDSLYPADKERRIQQELVLGVGGVRLLKRVNLFPTVVHMNEGHSAFSTLERIRYYLTEHKLSYLEARELIKATTLFTTHTPVPAGNEMFPDELVHKYLGPFMNEMKMDLEDFLNLGRVHSGEKEQFGMSPFSIRTSAYTNGVSMLHGQVSQSMWKDIWTELYDDEIPIAYVTNGVHIPTWVSDEFSRLFSRYIDPEWMHKIYRKEIWDRIDNIPTNELWKSQERLKDRLIGFVRTKYYDALTQRHASIKEKEDAQNLLDPDALTIGFARRFATYKRATLLFKDKERLKKILSDPHKPVQFIFAGKAHPADMEGKKLLEEIIHISREEGFKNKIAFLEDYDMEIARYLVQGVDVWLNTPRRPLEACGTSGIKVGINGGLNISIRDGWWEEAYFADIGWTIGRGEEYDNTEYQDFVESQSIYQILEERVIPTYFDRGIDHIPKEWVTKIKKSLKFTTQNFNSERMVAEYLEKFYSPATEKYNILTENNFSKTKEFSAWRVKIEQNWDNVSIQEFYSTTGKNDNHTGDEISFEAKINLGNLDLNDIRATLFWGIENKDGKIIYDDFSDMTYSKKEGDTSIFTVKRVLEKGGRFSYTVRLIPFHPLISRELEPGYIKWG